jgi:hypothetical protein
LRSRFSFVLASFPFCFTLGFFRSFCRPPLRSESIAYCTPNPLVSLFSP